MNSSIINVSRRGFMKGLVSSGALVLSVQLLPEALGGKGGLVRAPVAPPCIRRPSSASTATAQCGSSPAARRWAPPAGPQCRSPPAARAAGGKISRPLGANMATRIPTGRTRCVRSWVSRSGAPPLVARAARRLGACRRYLYSGSGRRTRQAEQGQKKNWIQAEAPQHYIGYGAKLRPEKSSRKAGTAWTRLPGLVCLVGPGWGVEIL